MHYFLYILIIDFCTSSILPHSLHHSLISLLPNPLPPAPLNKHRHYCSSSLLFWYNDLSSMSIVRLCNLMPNSLQYSTHDIRSALEAHESV